jgi:hypothetical protein
MGIETGMRRPIRHAVARGLRLAPIAPRRACVNVVGLVAPRIAARLASVLDVPRSPWPSSFGRLPLRRDTVAVWGYLRSEIGLGTAARGALEALRLTGRPTAGLDVPLPGRANVDYPVDAPCFRAGTNVAFVNPPEILTAESFFPHRALRDTRRVANWAWELSHLPPAWLPAAALFDEVWVGSNFVAQAVAASTARKVEILPNVVRERKLTARATARAAALGLPEEAFVFLCALDFASYPARKNPAGAIRAFVDAFPATDPDGPWLIVKSHGAATTDVVAARIMEACSGHPRVRAIHAVLSTQEMALLQDACDCIVSLHRSEGFGLNIAECMLAGKAAIATGYSGNMDFMDAANSYPVGYKLVDVRDGEYPNHQGQVWAEPDHEEAVQLMRHVASRREEARSRGEAARATILARFTSAVVARDWERLLG